MAKSLSEQIASARRQRLINSILAPIWATLLIAFIHEGKGGPAAFEALGLTFTIGAIIFWHKEIKRLERYRK